jgi:hypothetical protein
MTAGVRNKALIVAVLGASGSGKSAYVKKEIRRTLPSRLMIFDPLREYSEFGQVVTSLVELRAKSKASVFGLVFQPKTGSDIVKAQFDSFCEIAHAAERVTVVCEELSLVTTPSRSPEHWRAITLMGRHKGMKVYGLSQRPASIDKDFFSNATKVRCGRLNYAADIKTMANVMNVQPGQIQNLLPLEFIERETATGKVSTGKLTFK